VKPAVRRVVGALAEAGVEVRPIEFEQSTRTAEDAARALGAGVGQIVKSLLFLAGDEPLLVLVSGSNKASMPKLEAVTHLPVTRADAEAVRLATGYAIGGVPPLGHPRKLRTLVDADLLAYDVVYAAAGTPNSVFAIEPQELLRATGGEVADIKA
jgi:prolyl-tRNA editing enzyme YbaK/EbsC (Cys-tRNA(Pro) deacylase)